MVSPDEADKSVAPRGRFDGTHSRLISVRPRVAEPYAFLPAPGREFEETFGEAYGRLVYRREDTGRSHVLCGAGYSLFDSRVAVAEARGAPRSRQVEKLAAVLVDKVRASAPL